MASKKTQSKTFHLKEVVITSEDPTGTFTDLVHGAWTTFTTAKGRSYRVKPDSERHKVLNDLSEMVPVPRHIAGPIFSYTLNANMNAADIRSGARRTYPISVLAPPRDEKRRLEFVEGLVYFCATGNYFAFMANKTITLETLEEYFSWLLTKHVKKTVNVSFRDPPKPELKNYDMAGVKALTFQSPIRVGTTEENKSLSQSSGAVLKHEFYKTEGPAATLLEKFVSSLGATMPDLGLEKLNDLDQLEICVSLKLKRKGEYAKSAAAIRKVAEAFRNIEKPPVEFLFKDGRKLNVADLRIAQTMSVPCQNDIPVEKETLVKLHTWMTEQIVRVETETCESDEKTK